MARHPWKASGLWLEIPELVFHVKVGLPIRDNDDKVSYGFFAWSMNTKVNQGAKKLSSAARQTLTLTQCYKKVEFASQFFQLKACAEPYASFTNVLGVVF